MSELTPEEIFARIKPRPPKPEPVRYDLGAMLKENLHLLSIIQLFRINKSYLSLELMAVASFDSGPRPLFVHIDCVNAVDYYIRPPNPGLLMGGPWVEFHEQHPLLKDISQTVPNTDGLEIYDPPVNFGVLVIDQSLIIAGQFALRFVDVDGFKNLSGMSDERRQRSMTLYQQLLDRMEPFRLKGLKTFPTRPFRPGE